MRRCDKLVDAGRRAFFARTAAVAAGAAATAAIPSVAAHAAPSLALVVYPSSKLGNVRDLKVNQPQDIDYPDADSPGVLLKLGSRVEGGAGPDGDIVAFSTLCPHKGFPLNYVPGDKSLSCPGHYSRFDVEKGGLQIFGHATQNLPQFRLVVDQNGDIYAVAVDELIYGRLSNVLTA
jgi:arsenite oxidase small subunit